MTTLFLDTSYIIALEAADEHHTEAGEYWQRLTQSLPPMVTTSSIFDKNATFFHSRNRHAKVVEIGNRLLRGPSVHSVHVDEALFYEAWQYFEHHAAKLYSLTDWVSFVVMRQMGVRTTMTFDRHFIQSGFERVP